MPASFFSLHSSVLLPALPDCPPPKEHEPGLALRVGAAVVPVALTATPVAPGCAARADGGTCPEDWTPHSKIQDGDCSGNELEYELVYFDSPLGTDTEEDTGESSLQDIACIDGHDVCAYNCQLERQEIISPPAPTAYIVNYGNDGYCQTGCNYGTISWEWQGEEIYDTQDCDPYVQNCWTDLTESYPEGDSEAYEWECDQTVEVQTPPPTSPAGDRAKGARP